MSDDRDEFDPEAPERREIGRETVDQRTEPGAVVAHPYRGEVDARSTGVSASIRRPTGPSPSSHGYSRTRSRTQRLPRDTPRRHRNQRRVPRHRGPAASALRRPAGLGQRRAREPVCERAEPRRGDRTARLARTAESRLQKPGQEDAVRDRRRPPTPAGVPSAVGGVVVRLAVSPERGEQTVVTGRHRPERTGMARLRRRPRGTPTAPRRPLAGRGGHRRAASRRPRRARGASSCPGVTAGAALSAAVQTFTSSISSFTKNRPSGVSEHVCAASSMRPSSSRASRRVSSSAASMSSSPARSTSPPVE